jgi:hypothetical protein
MRKRFEHRREAQRFGDDPGSAAEHTRHAEAEREVSSAQPNTLIEMREHGEIDNVVLRRLQPNLDLLASRLPVEGGLAYSAAHVSTMRDAEMRHRCQVRKPNIRVNCLFDEIEDRLEPALVSEPVP